MVRLPAETSSMMPTTANITRIEISPRYSPRSRMNGHRYISAMAEMTKVTNFSASAPMSRMNSPSITSPCPPTPQATSTAASSRVATDSAWVTTRRRSSRNRSSISSPNAPATTVSSGSSGENSAKVRTGASKLIATSSSSKLGGGQQLRQLRDGRLHQVGQRLRPHADQQHAGGEGAQHQDLAPVDVLQPGHVGVAHFPVEDPLDQPQRVRGADDQGQRGGEGDQRMALERGHDHHEFADEAGGARQARVGHAEEHEQRS